MTGEELKRFREKIGYSQQRVADLIGSTLRTWQDWEYGITPVPGSIACLVLVLIRYKGAVNYLKGRKQ